MFKNLKAKGNLFHPNFPSGKFNHNACAIQSAVYLKKIFNIIMQIEQDKEIQERAKLLKKDKRLPQKLKIKSKNIEVPKSVRVPINASDMVVVTKVKNLIRYIFQITEKSPKKFRFTFVNRMQNLGLDCVENLYNANSINIKDITKEDFQKRKSYQYRAINNLKILQYISLLATDAILINNKIIWNAESFRQLVRVFLHFIKCFIA